MCKKMELIRKFEISLFKSFDAEQIQNISNSLLVLLNDYEVKSVEKSLIVYDDSFDELIAQFASNLIIRGKSKGTVKMYCREVKKLYEMCGKPAKDIKAIDIKQYLASLMQRGISKRTIANSKNYISAFFNWLVDEEIIEKNPCSSVHPVKFSKKVHPSFNDVEMDALRGVNMSLRNRAIIEVLVSSGLRVSELCNLDVFDVDLSSLKVHVRGGKGDKDRITYISRVASSYLKKYLSDRKSSSSALFLSYEERGEEYQKRISTHGIGIMLNKISEQSGVSNVHPHRFRHTFATNLYNKGMDIHEIQRLLGHTNIQVTLTYIDSDDISLGASYLKHMI